MKKSAFNSINSWVFLILAVSLIAISCGKENASSKYKSGSAKYQLKDYRGAIEDFTKAIEIKDDYIEAYYSRAICQSKIGKAEKALADFNKVTELNPKHKNAVFNRAYYVKQQTGDYQSAIEDYDLFLELNKEGENAFTFNNLGFCKFMMNDTVGALNDITTSLQLDSTNSLAFKNRAEIYIAMDSISQACIDLNKSIKFGFTKAYGEEAIQLKAKYCQE